MSGEVNSHRSVSFLSAQPNDLFNLCDTVLVLEATCEILSLRPELFKDTFLFDVVQFDGEPLFALQLSTWYGVQPVRRLAKIRDAFLRVDKDLHSGLRGRFYPHDVDVRSRSFALQCRTDPLPVLHGIIY